MQALWLPISFVEKSSKSQSWEEEPRQNAATASVHVMALDGQPGQLDFVG